MKPDNLPQWFGASDNNYHSLNCSYNSSKYNCNYINARCTSGDVGQATCFSHWGWVGGGLPRTQTNRSLGRFVFFVMFTNFNTFFSCACFGHACMRLISLGREVYVSQEPLRVELKHCCVSPFRLWHFDHSYHCHDIVCVKVIHTLTFNSL